MRRVVLLSLAALAGCHGSSGGDTKTVKNAEALVRKTIKDPAVKFEQVQSFGDAETGATCGYFTRTNVFGGTDAVRFIVFADGNEGANPYVNDAAAPYPQTKSDFAGSWRKQCIKAGYVDPHPSEDKKKKKKSKK